MIGNQMVGRIRSIALCVLVLLVAFAPVAYALPGPVVVESDGWNSNYTALCAETSQDRAAAAFCGIDWDERLNEDQRTYLLSDDDWLAFRNAIHLSDNPGADFFAFPFFSGAAWDAQIYVVDVDGAVFGSAKKVLNDVMSGKVSNLVFDDDYVICPGTCYITTGTPTTWTDDNGVVYTNRQTPPEGQVRMPDAVNLAIPKSLFQQVQSTVPSDDYFYYFHCQGNTWTINAFPPSCYPEYTNQNNIKKIWRIQIPANSEYVTVSLRGNPYPTTRFDGTTLYLTGLTGATASLYTSPSNNSYFAPPVSGTSGIVTIPTEPDPQPDPPIQPPDPGTDVPTVDPPVWPTIDFPDITIHGAPITITWPTIANDADYTELLKQIIKRLEKIGDLCGDIVNDMDEHCEHLQQAIQDAAEYIVDNLELGIDPDLDDLVRGIDNAWRKITQTIKEQVKWLADQLDYDFTVTLDLDKIEQYLRRIISKMGGGTSKPDPTNDPFSWGDWLDDLWRKIFTALQIALPDELGQLLELFDILKTKFPFSVPWDLIAIVALFDHEPVAPVLMLPYPTLTLDAGGLSGGYLTFEVDFSDWDSAMTMVRDIELLLFTAYLISQTHWALDAIKPPAKG